MSGLLATLQPPPLDWILVTAIALALAVALSWAWERFCRLLWAFGLDRRHRMAFTIAPFRLLLLLGVWAAIAMPAWDSWSSLEIVVPAGILTVLATLWALPHLWDVVGGLRISVTRPFTIGDQVATDVATGRVLSLGLTKVRIQSAYGELVDVPARDLSSRTVRVASRTGGALPIQVSVGLPPTAEPDLLLESLRDHALMSAYCDASRPVIVELTDAKTARITATPVNPDDADELRSDLTGRAGTLERVRLTD